MKKAWDPAVQSKPFWARKLKTYQLSRTDFLEIFEAQGGCCQICQKVFRSSPHVDHDHQTGAVRGLLDYRCNKGLGFFDERPDFLARAVEYLRRGKIQTALRGA